VTLTNEYTDQYITDSKNHGFARFIFLIDELSINFRSSSLQYTWSIYYQYTCSERVSFITGEPDYGRPCDHLYVRGLSGRTRQLDAA